MPYRTVSELPKAVKAALPIAAQQVFMNVVNSQLKRGLSEDKAFASAWGALKNQGWQKDDSGKWRKIAKSNEFELQGEISKINEEQHLAFGWASVIFDKDGNEVVDSQGDVISEIELEKSAYTFVEDFRHAGEMHENTIGIGHAVESMVFTKEKQQILGIPEGILPIGWWIGFRLSPEIFAKVKSGKYKMFSIGGSGKRTAIE